MEDISLEVIELLRKEGLTLTHLWILKKYQEGEVLEIPEVKALERKVYILEDSLTEAGKEFLISLESCKKVEKKNKDEINEAFDKWWGTRNIDGIYPSTNAFSYMGKDFNGVQKKTIKKEDCKAEFRKIVLSGEFTCEEILQGTENHLLMAKKDSLKRRENQISFIPASIRYLKERFFSPYIKKIETKIETDSSVDI